MDHFNKEAVAWLIPGQLAKSFVPDSDDLAEWKQSGIKSVVNLLETHFDDIVQQERLQGFKVLHLPIPDMCAPPIEQLELIVKWIDREISDGKRVLVHCYAGIGRTGTVLTAYLIYKGEEIKHALEKVLAVGSEPQSFEQLERLEEYSLLIDESAR